MIAKIFYLSAILEPMLYFLIVDRTQFGFNLSLSRLLQLCSILLLILKNGKIKKIDNILKGNYAFIIPLLLLIIIASVLLGLINESYKYNLVKLEKNSGGPIELFALFARPAIEVILVLYLYWYHISLGKFFTKNNDNVLVLVKFYLFLTVTSIILGLADISLKMIDDGNLSYEEWSISWGFLPRHFAEYFYDSGMQRFTGRFHGLYGEPRDAVGPLVAFLAILKFIEVSDPKNLIRIRWSTYIVCTFCILSTNSISGMLSIPLFLILYIFSFMVGIIRLKIELVLSFIIFTSVSVLIVFILVNDEESRFYYYFITYSDIFQRDLSSVFSDNQKTQLVNFYPLMIFNKLCFTDFSYKCFIGSGIASSGFANSIIMKTGHLTYPFSDFVRILYDIGIIGIFIYSFFILTLAKKLITKNNNFSKEIRAAFYFFMFAFATTLAHRSFTIWIILLFYISINSITESKKNEIFEKIKKTMFFKYIFKQKI
ncbi:hypothetical protein N9835_00140 [Alphaproteobacteria bacterium]|nr:hypothetical protein [Alphaproteobacteria bacterium]